MMKKSQEKFKLLRSILKTLGLSPEATDDIVERIVDLLSVEGGKSSSKPEYPYHLRDDFLSPAEHSFYLVLKHTLADQAVICTKVSLSDLFYVKSRDRSKFRIYTNKIDRKHVDFLICHPKTMQPLMGIELDDKSHQKSDRRARDKFVEKVYTAAKLPLVRFPVRRSYSTTEIHAALQQHIETNETDSPTQPVDIKTESENPHCPKCDGEMVLRTAKQGVTQGEKFWGCPNYPRCRGVRRYST